MAKYKFPKGYLVNLAEVGFPDRPDECWEWPGSRDSFGYGMVSPRGGRTTSTRMLRAHRVCYEAQVGPIPPGADMDHICHEPSCFNPKHVVPSTRKENCENKSGLNRDNKSGYRGVYQRSDGKWRACARHNGVLINAGTFADVHEAGAAAAALREQLGFRDTTGVA